MKRTGKVRPKDPLTWIAMVAAMLIVMSSSIAMAGTFDAWDFSMKITFSGYEKPETLTNFPALVVLSTNIDNFSYTNFYSASGADLRFAASNETTELNYEIEKWDTNGESFVWVQVPELASTNDFIYAYLGMNTNAPAYTTNGATWSNGYAGVWHMAETNLTDETTGGTNRDATANANHGIQYNSSPIAGRIAGAQSFDGSVDYIDCGTGPSLDVGPARTISAWIKPSTLKANAGIVSKDSNRASLYSYMMCCHNDGTLVAYDTIGWLPSDNAGISAGNWYHAVFETKGDGNIYFYVNGQSDGSATWSHTDDTNDNVYIGSWYSASTIYDFDGIIDEARISDVARGSNWVWACWLSQASNDVFISYDTVDPNATNLAVATRPASDIGLTNTTLNGKVLHTGDQENPQVYFCWDYTDKGTTSTGVWGNVEYMGTNWGKGELFATNVTGLLSGSNYHYRCYVTNSTGEDWSDDAQSFTTIYPPSVTNTGATNVFRQVATLQGEITDTGLDTPQVWLYYWLGSSTSTVAMGLQSGAFSKQITDFSMDSTYYYKILASNMAGIAWSGEKSFETLPFGTGTNIWTGEGVTDNWSEHANWSAGGVPLAGEHVIITNAATEVLLSSSTPDLASFTITNAALMFTNWTTTLSASNVTIQSDGTLTLPGAFTESQMSNRVHVVCTNFTLASGGTVNADEKGYVAGYGPGKATGGGGGGYGGRGEGSTGGGTYGSTNAPVEPGSGSTYCVGGGAVRVEATDVVTVHGTISANGQYINSGGRGGGSGGSIFITCNQLAGSANGILRANGGNGRLAGGGGGGRIAVIYNEAAQTNRPGVRFSTNRGYNVGGVPYYPYLSEIGTVYLTNTLFLTETLADELFMNVKLFIPGFTNWGIESLTMSNCIVTFGAERFQLNVTNDVLFDSGAGLTLSANSRLSCGGNMTLTNGGSLSMYSGVTNAAGTDYRALVSVTGDVSIYSNSWIYPYSHETNGGSALLTMSNLTIAAGGGFNADEKGYVAGYGPGRATSSGGGGYGGRGGGGTGGGTYGSTNAPVEPGSGSTYCVGGGAVRVEATDVVTVHGTISANGQYINSGGRGGGSGGSIFITCNQLAGSANGILRANGGNGRLAGGGGGGRIAVWYAVPENRLAGILDGTDMRRVAITNKYSEFEGTVSTTNGTGIGGGDPGEPGTIVFLTVTPPSGTMFMCQ